jgi:uncharacterized membrane protein YozB (DUF420 family)
MLALSLGTFPFPEVNASLNGASAVLLVAALICIKTRQIKAHTILVLTALTTSIVFLACYITFHVYRHNHGIDVTRYPAASPLRPLYVFILTSHTILAAVTVPLVLITVTRAAKRLWPNHRKIAAWTFPIWLYVSVTGVIIYWMLSAAGAYRPH